MDCIFCKIMNGEIPTTKVYEDEYCFAFRDIEPLAPEHFLVIPRKHITSAAEIDQEMAPVVGHIYEVIGKLAKEMNFQNGFRVVTNCGPDAGQTVPHLHFHVLAGKQLGSFN
jgi:histidine triad (HIT) family protein